MAQEQLPDEAEVWGPYYYGTKCLFWSKGKIKRYKPIEWMSVPTSEVPIDVQDKSSYFMNTMINNLCFIR